MRHLRRILCITLVIIIIMFRSILIIFLLIQNRCFPLLKSTPYDDISWSNNWQKSKHRAFFIAPTIIKIKNIICEIETYARYLHVMCEWIFLNLLQINWKIIVKIVLFYTIIYARWLDNTFIWPNYEGI